VLREYAALQCVALLARHRRDVERVGRLLILRLLQLPAVHQLDVGHGRPRRLPRVLVVEAAAQRSEDLRPVIVERACCAFAVEVARSRGVDAHLIEDESEIDEAWLCGVETVGVTAGASSPESLVSRVLAWFRERGVEQTRTQDTESENVSFRAPVEPRSSSGVA
jgi:LytB protein